MSYLFDVLKLIRVVNCLMASASVWVGACLTVGPRVTVEIGSAMAGAFFLCAAGNVVNDLYDIEGDRVSHPDRPLVTKRISIKAGRRLSVGAHILTLVGAALAGTSVLAVAAISLVLLYLYNARLKRVPLIGNIVVAILAGVIFLCGGLAAGGDVFRLPGPLIAVGLAFLFHLIREIVKDTEDMAGDRRAGVRTLPQIIGERAALSLALVVFLGLAVLTLVPVWRGWYSGFYEAIVIVFIDIPLLGLLGWTVWEPSGEHLRWSRAALKAGMAVGLVALVVA